MEHVDVVDGEVFRLELILLGLKQFVLSGHQFDGILQSYSELLRKELVTVLCTLCAHLGGTEFLLIVLGLEPVVFNRRIKGGLFCPAGRACNSVSAIELC